MKALSLSPSALRLYLRCPFAYGLDKIAKVPRWQRVIGPQLHTGRALHTVLEQLVQQVELAPEEAAAALDRTFSWNAYEDRQTAEAAYRAAHESLKTWLGTPYGWQAGETLAVEKTLRSRERNGIVLTGRPDLVRVHPADGSLEVIDHKSGAHIPSPERLKADCQAGIYRILAEERWPGYPEYRVSFSFLASAAVIPIAYTPAEVAEWWQILLAVGEQIRKARTQTEHDIPLEEAFVPQPGAQCAGCTFKKVCPYRASEADR